MKTLLLYSSRDGHTQEIASFIASRLSEQDISADVIDLNHVTSITWEQYSSVVIGASIRYGSFHPSLITFVKRYTAQMNARPSAFFSVNLVARKADKRTPQTNSYTRKFLLNSPWQPTLCVVFAGALRYPRYRWYDRIMIRLIMKMTGGETDSSKEVDYTNWEQVTAFAHDIVHLTRSPAIPQENCLKIRQLKK